MYFKLWKNEKKSLKRKEVQAILKQKDQLMKDR